MKIFILSIVFVFSGIVLLLGFMVSDIGPNWLAGMVVTSFISLIFSLGFICNLIERKF